MNYYKFQDDYSVEHIAISQTHKLTICLCANEWSMTITPIGDLLNLKEVEPISEEQFNEVKAQFQQQYNNIGL